MEFEDQEEATSYNPLKMSNHPSIHQTRSSSSSSPPPSPLSLSIPPAKKPAGRYRECLKNHAVGIGGQAVDGCGEFMPAGEEDTIDALKCAACNCHRNFHRKEVEPTHNVAPITYYPNFQFQSFNSRTNPSGYPNQRQLALPSGQEPAELELGSSGRKRFRTKFSSEQKEKMLELAEKIGWRFQKQDDEVIQRFCQENGMKLKVLKVWMHNNKQHYLGKKP